MKALLSVGVVLLAGCTAHERESEASRPQSSAESLMGYKEAVSLGTQYCSLHGYADVDLQAAEPYGANIWCVRYGLKKSDGKRVLELHVDAHRKEVVQSMELDGGTTPWVHTQIQGAP